MTIVFRNSILLVTIILGLILVVFAVFTVLFFTVIGDNNEVLMQVLRNEKLVEQRWLFFVWSPDNNRFLWSVVGLLLSSVSAVGGSIVILRLFRRTTASEMFFFTFFLLSITLNVVRLGFFWIYFYDISPYYGIFITKIVYFGYYFGIFALFTASLFVSSVDYKNIGSVVGILFFIALLVAYAVPVNSQLTMPNLVFRIGNEVGMQMVHLLLALLTCANLAVSYYKTRSGVVPFYLLGFFLCLVGRQLWFFLAGPISLGVGTVFFLIGVEIFVRNRYRTYLWE